VSTRIIRKPRDPGSGRRRRTAPEGTRVIRSTHLEALAEAEQIRSRAEQEARRVREQAIQEAAQIRRRALEESHAEAAALLVRARAQAGDTLEQSGGQLTRLAVAIAEKLLGEALRLEPERVERIVSRCLEHARDQAARHIVLRVNPDDLGAVERALPRLGRRVEAELLKVEPDPGVTAGGCLVDTELGQLDGRLETQLRAILDALEQDP
jgi:flagellar biosynthesis/type III secretory pathway protein FliH